MYAHTFESRDLDHVIIETWAQAAGMGTGMGMGGSGMEWGGGGCPEVGRGCGQD
jgi:hypothetical protein